MHFEQLDDDYRDDHIAQALYAREMEFFHYDFDRANFELLLADLEPGNYFDMIHKRLGETLVQMARVEAIHAALVSRITDPQAHLAAVERCARKRSEKT